MQIFQLDNGHGCKINKQLVNDHIFEDLFAFMLQKQQT